MSVGLTEKADFDILRYVCLLSERVCRKGEYYICTVEWAAAWATWAP